jgi:hypothetical protein
MAKADKVSRVKLADIKEGGHHNKDLAEVADLAQSINNIGLLRPPVLTSNLDIIAGRGRILAARMLKWETIPACILDLDKIAQGVYAARAYAKVFTPSEIVAIGDALEDLGERNIAKRQMSMKGGNSRGREGAPGPSDILGRLGAVVSMSHETYEKARAVVYAAALNPEIFGDMVREMDQTGKVDSCFKRVTEIKKLRKKHRAETTLRVSERVPTLNRLVTAGEVNFDDAWIVAQAMSVSEQQALVTAGAGAVSAKAEELRWLRNTEWLLNALPKTWDLEKNVSQKARNAALERLKEVRHIIDGWIRILKK